MRYRSFWVAVWEKDILHISGITDRFPNDFSVGTLQRVGHDESSGTVTYRLVFNRDKEPYCDKDLVGPVHYFERELPPSTTQLRIEDGTAHPIDIQVPEHPSAA